MTGKGVSLLLVLLLSNTVGAAYIKYNGDFNCSYPVMVTVDSMTCDGEEYCRFGDEMDVSGSMTLEENLPSSEMCVTTKACLLGLDWMCKTYKETMNVCNAVGISGDYDGTPCPNAGAFFFGSTVQLPGKPNYAIGSGWWIDVRVIVEDCNEYKDYFFTCEATFSAVSSSDAVFNNTTTAVSGVGLVGLAAFAYYYATRKREQQQAASIDLAYEEQQMVGGEDQHSSSGFQMMKDSVRV